MRIERALVAILLCMAAAAAWAGPRATLWPGGAGPYIGVDLLVGTPSARGDVFKAVFPGASLRFLASRHLEFSLDYAFMEIEYYYPESGAGPWHGPLQWSSMPDRFSGMRPDWIFYHTKHFIAPQAWYVAPLDDLGLPLAIRIGAGPAISLIVPNEAAKFYPGLSDAFEQFKESFKAYLGLSLRLGLEYRPWSHARIGLEYLFVVDSLIGMAGDMAKYGLDYLDRAGNFLVFAGARL
jgi:hypothetical protein